MFDAIDKSIAVEGNKLMILLRIQPLIPWNHLNYILSVTSCSFKSYLVGLYIGIAPGTLSMLYVGVNIKSIAEIATGAREINGSEIAFLIISLAAVALVVVLITRESKR